MAEKKRKGETVVDPPSKKTKKTKSSEIETPKPSSKSKLTIDGTTANESTKASSTANIAAQSSKKSRKRAADFLEDDVNTAESALAPSDAKFGKAISSATVADSNASNKKRSKKTETTAPLQESLTADGSNGVIEHVGDEDAEPTSANKNVELSLQAEAQRTADKELEDEFGVGSDAEDSGDDADQGAALLAGFDSDTSDHAADDNVDTSRMPPIPMYKKVSKLIRKAKEQPQNEAGVVYIGRIPHGFYEKEMRQYFEQFGEINRLRLSRNKKTGASKHFAFIEFASDEVAEIVAQTMDNYLMFGHILKCKYAPADTLHPDVWKGANKKYRKIPHEKLEREKLAAPKSEAYWDKKIKKEKKKRDQRAQKLREIGYEMPKSTLVRPSTVIEQRKLEEANQATAKQIEASDKAETTNGTVAEPTGAIEPPKGVPKDALALAKSEEKKSKSKSKKQTSSKTEASISQELPSKAAVQEQPEAGTTEKKSKIKKLNESAPTAMDTAEVATNKSIDAKPKGKEVKSILKKTKSR